MRLLSPFITGLYGLNYPPEAAGSYGGAFTFGPPATTVGTYNNTRGRGVSAGFAVVARLSTYYPGTPALGKVREGVNVFDFNGTWDGDLVLRSGATVDWDTEEFRYPIHVSIEHHVEEYWMYQGRETGLTLVRGWMNGYNNRAWIFEVPSTIPSPDLSAAFAPDGGSDSYAFPDDRYNPPNWLYGDSARSAQWFKGAGENGAIYSGDIHLPVFRRWLDPERYYQLRIEGSQSQGRQCRGDFLFVFTGFPVAVPTGVEEEGVIRLDGSGSAPHAKAAAYNGMELVNPRPVMKRAAAVAPASLFTDGDTSLSYEWEVNGQAVGTGLGINYEYSEDDLVLAPATAAEADRLATTPFQDGYDETFYQPGVVASLKVTDTFGGRHTTSVFVPVQPSTGRLVSGIQDPSGVSLEAEMKGTGASKYLLIQSHDGREYLERARLNDYQAPCMVQVLERPSKYLLAQHRASKVFRLLASDDFGKAWEEMSEPWDANTKDAVACGARGGAIITARIHKSTKVVEVKVSRDGGKEWEAALSPGGNGKSLAIWRAQDGSNRVFLSNAGVWTRFTDEMGRKWEDLPA